MARIKKLQESGATIYPATITDAIKDHETQQGLNEILDDIDEELELAANARSPIILYADELIIDENGVISNMVEASYMPSLESFIDAWKQTKVVVVVEGENTYNGTTVFRADRGVNYLCWSNGQLRKTITYRFSGVGGQQTLTARYTEEADYAQKDGNYPQLTAGFAENIVGDGTATEEEFSFRPTAGVDRNVETTTYDYDMRSNFGARIESVKGNSVVWNQLYDIVSIFNFPEGLTVTLNEDGSVTINGTVTEKSYITYNAPLSILSGHKYFLTSSNNASNTYLQVPSSYTPNFVEGFVTANTNENINYPRQVVNAGVTFNNEVVRPRIYDLTQMFGAGNEPTTIEEFYARLPKNVDINAYNKGEMVDANYGAIKTTGFNQWDEQWEVGNIDTSTGLPSISSTTCRSKNFTRVLGGCIYAFTMGNTTSGIRLFQYNDSYEMVGVNTLNAANSGNADFYRVTLLADTKYIKIVCLYSATYLNDICINIAWDEYSALNGSYAPYKPFVRDLSWISKYFTEGKMRRAGSVSDEIRFNSTTQKWETVQRVGTVDLGSLTWTRQERPTGVITWRFSASLNTMVNQGESLNLLCAPYVTNTSPVGEENIDDTIAAYNARVYIADTTYTTAEELTIALSGVMLNYELATPIVTEIEEIPSLDYDVADYGTEELIVAEGVKSAPFLGDIIYTPNALKTLEQVPDILRRLSALETAMTTTTTTTTTTE